MMNLKNIERYKANNKIDPEIETDYSFFSSSKHTCGVHCHDFFEIFLIIEGSIIHCINNCKEILDEGSLVFIRPNDVHSYEHILNRDCSLINLSFMKKTVNELINYLGSGFPKSYFLESDMPFVIKLTKEETLTLRIKLDELHYIPMDQKGLIKAKLRALLAEVFSKYLLAIPDDTNSTLPLWLITACNEMKKGENFILGLEALLRITGKSHSYLCRCFKQYLGITPIQFINELRFSYAQNLLLKTDMEILDICLEIGIDNLGYFYKEFKSRFHTTPAFYRKANSNLHYL